MLLTFKFQVQNSLRHHLERWRTQKSVGKISRQSTSHKSSRYDSRRSTRDTCSSHITTASDSCTTMKDIKCLTYETQSQISVKGHMLWSSTGVILCMQISDKNGCRETVLTRESNMSNYFIISKGFEAFGIRIKVDRRFLHCFASDKWGNFFQRTDKTI